MANGFQSEFKVYPVQMVTKMSRVSRENGRQNKRQPNSAKNPAFDIILSDAMESKAPADCYTVTYNADRQLQTYFYRQSKEYTF